jgi:hypothetical protein
MKIFDPSVPRKMYWSNKIPNKLRCPHCKSKLEKEYQSYLLTTRSQGEYETFISGNDYGTFCSQCPIVVLDFEGINQIIQQVFDRTDWIKSPKLSFAVLGMLDLDAVPEEKRDQSFGTDDNPYPLVSFLDHLEGNEGGQIPRKGKRLSGNKRRRQNRV